MIDISEKRNSLPQRSGGKVGGSSEVSQKRKKKEAFTGSGKLHKMDLENVKNVCQFNNNFTVFFATEKN